MGWQYSESDLSTHHFCLQHIHGRFDKNDQMKSYYTIPVSGKKWWSRVLFDLLDRAIFNSFILEQESPNQEKWNLKDFRIFLAKDLIGDFSSSRKHGRPSNQPVARRFVERHFPELLPVTEKGRRKGEEWNTDVKCV